MTTPVTRLCPKNAAVVLVARWPAVSFAAVPTDVPLCGGHFDVHRLGKPLEVVL